MKLQTKAAFMAGLIPLVLIAVLLQPVPGRSQTVETSEELIGAVEALDRGNYETAVEVLSEYPNEAPLSSYAKYLLSKAYLGSGRPKEALDSLEGIEAGRTEEVLKFERYYLQAKALHALDRNDRAGDLGQEAESYAETTEEKSKLYELRSLIARERGDFRKELKFSIRLMETTNLRFIGEERERLFDRTEEIIERLSFEDQELQRQLYSFIETLIRYREYRRARSLLLRHMGDWTGDVKTSAYFRLAWLDGQKLDFPEEALWTFQRLLRSDLDASQEARGKYYLALTKNEAEDEYDLVGNLLRINDAYPDTYFGKMAARKAFEQETEDANLSVLDETLERYKNRLSRRAVRDQTWRLFFKSYARESFKSALDYLGILESYYDTTPPKFHFWRRKVRIASPELEAGSDLEVATFQRNSPTDYYSLLAGEKGWSRGSFQVSETWADYQIGLEEVEGRLLEGDFPGDTLARIEMAILLKEHGLLRTALARLERVKSDIPEHDYLFLKFRWQRLAGRYRESLKAASALMGWYYEGNRRPPVGVVEGAYPRYYSEEVNRAAGRFGLPTELIYAVIRQESAFDRLAYSTAKAGGLMQVIPSTARGIAQDLGKEKFRFEDLFDTEVAVEYGSYYVNKQLSDTEDARLGLIAYHGGPGNLSRWREEYGAKDVDLFVERIPKGSTENYVKAVYRNYLVYRNLY
ncbi:MAG: transglycosylase SLT domain-containing protein [Candidatus Acetothermia bacterium]